MRVYYLGTCSGTEPRPGAHHCSLIIEVGDAYYWFDAGEGCAHTAANMGLDVAKSKCVFISHSHTDHIGGFPPLLSWMAKMHGRFNTPLRFEDTLRIFAPELDIIKAVRIVGVGSMSGKYRFNIEEHEIRAGVVFEDENIRVTAINNSHMQNKRPSFSFLVEADGRRLVFSGDVGAPEELDPIIEGCDLLIMETGHHSVLSVCDYAASRGVSRLRFNHHGREILDGRAAAEDFVAEYASSHGMDMVICYDTMNETV